MSDQTASDQTRPTARDFDPEVLRLFDLYVHGDIDRRGFLSGTARVAGGMAAATGLLALLAPRFAAAQQVAPDDARIATSQVGFDSPQGYGKARGYLARPAKAAVYQASSSSPGRAGESGATRRWPGRPRPRRWW